MRKKIAWTLREFAKNLYVFPAASCSVLDGVAEGGVGGSSRRGSKLAVYGVIRALGLLLPIAPAKLPSSIGSWRGLLAAFQHAPTLIPTPAESISLVVSHAHFLCHFLCRFSCGTSEAPHSPKRTDRGHLQDLGSHYATLVRVGKDFLSEKLNTFCCVLKAYARITLLCGRFFS